MTHKNADFPKEELFNIFKKEIFKQDDVVRVHAYYLKSLISDKVQIRSIWPCFYIKAWSEHF